MPTLTEYLQRRFSKANALTHKEARIIALPWPLPKGWPTKFGDIEIDRDTYNRLVAISDRRHASLTTDRAERRKEKKARRQERKSAIADAVQRQAPKVRIKKPAPDPAQGYSAKFTPEFLSSVDFLVTYEWRKLRMEVLVKHGRRCMCCGATPDHGAVMNVDHIKPRRLFPELALDINNLQVLCGECNHGKGNWDMTDWRSC